MDAGLEKKQKKVEEFRSAWRYKAFMSTLPRWGNVQKHALYETEDGLKGVDLHTRDWIMKELLLTLRCHQCERRLTDQCHFNICIRGLLSGVE
jgi:hypothetical protein